MEYKYKLEKGLNKIIIIIKEEILYLNCMFSKYSSLKNIEGLKYFDTKKFNNLWGVFQFCESLSDIKPLEN